MTRVALAAVLAALLAGSGMASALTTPHAVSAGVPPQTTERVAFRSHFGFGRSRYGVRRVYRPRHSLLRRVVKTAFWLYVLHLFTAHGGLSILLWIIILAFVVALVRRRRRRYVY
jgi:hypothetical protein